MNTLKSKEGMYLTQLEEVEDRTYVTAIIGMNATYEYWKDATKEEKDEYENKKAAAEEK